MLLVVTTLKGSFSWITVALILACSALYFFVSIFSLMSYFTLAELKMKAIVKLD